MTGAAPADLAARGAAAVLRSFATFHAAFRAITARAGVRFAERDWHGLQDDAAARLDLYGRSIDAIVADTRAVLGARVADHAVWREMKRRYSARIAARADLELAETYFNSLTRRIFSTVGVDPEIEFVDSDFDVAARPGAAAHIWRRYQAPAWGCELLARILRDVPLAAPFADLARDARLVHQTLLARPPMAAALAAPPLIEVARPLFFRNTNAYLVARVLSAGAVSPLVLALRHPAGGLVVDAVLTDPDEVSIVFSFTRSYFHVDVERPHELVGLLHSILPQKPLAELYISIGFNKHGKTELYRTILRHLAGSADRFEDAPGEEGLVMMVFTLPGLDLVFKVIRDQPGYPKRTTRREVLDRYRLVFTHDRVGRLVDAQEFEHLRLARSRFTEPLLARLLADAADTVSIDGEHVVVRHLFAERRVQPMNLFLRRADAAAARAAVLDLGWAIKDLAAANIFPGDLLLKNFGVTRHGRVVFYDYDELCLLTDCTFRRIPAARTEEDELAEEPWYFVGENDVFPEELRTFLGLAGDFREAFLAAHADLCEVDFWQRMQARQRAGEVMEDLAYPPSRRLAREVQGDRPTGC